MAVALGAILLSEPLTIRTLVATVLIVGAVIALVSGRQRASDGTDPALVPVHEDVPADRRPAASTD